MRRLMLLLGLVLTALWTVPRIATAATDSSGTHSYTSTCEAGLPRFTNTSDPFSTGNGVIEFRAAGATLTLSPGQSGVLEPDEVTPNTPWDVVFFDLGEPYVFDGGTFGICESSTTSTTAPPTYSVSVAEGCTNGEPVLTFTNAGTGTMYATIGMSAQPLDPGATATASWPTAHGDPYPEFDWHASELPDPTGDIGPEFATGTVFLANACGVTTGPVDSPNGVIRNLGGAIPAALLPLTAAAPAPVATFEGIGTTALDLGSGLLADDELYLLDVVFKAGDSDTLIIDELDENFAEQGSGLSWFNGSFEGRFLLNSGDTTTRYLRVDAQGSWTLTIWPFLPSVEQWPGGEAHDAGPNVLLFIGDPGVVSFAHRGERNFIVGFYGDDGYPAASINELENVDGTVIVPISPAVVVVDATGEWWLRR
jgi:hypothetical protein